MEKENILEKSYLEDLQKIKETIRENQNKIMVVANKGMIFTYYQIGTIINQRKKWGNKYIERLSNDLKHLKGYSIQNLYRMKRFAEEFDFEEVFPQAGGIIPWRTLTDIIEKCNSKKEKLYYIKKVYENSWSRNMLINQIEMKSYERSLLNPIVSEEISKSNNELVNTLFKDSYVFNFLDRENIRTEDDLKRQMINHILDLLEEFGKGFSLVGKEYKLSTPTNKEFKIDLLLYHTKIHAYIVIEVKLGEFKPADYGQLVFYVNAIDRLEKTNEDNPTIGLLLCKEADTFVAETTLKSSSSYIGISKYKYIEELPDYLIRKLNK